MENEKSELIELVLKSIVIGLIIGLIAGVLGGTDIYKLLGTQKNIETSTLQNN